MQTLFNIHLRLITIVFSYVQVIIPNDIVSICSNEYDIPSSHYDDANVLFQMMYKTPATVP